MTLSWRQLIPFLFTCAAMVVGFYSMLMSAAGEYVQAAQLIMVSMILDGLDGTLARALKGTTQVGAELDTFVDLTSFGLAPALMAYQAVLKDYGLCGFMLASAIVLSGVYRLSRFRVVDPFRGQKGYLGLPITTNAGWMASFFIATECGQIDREWFALDHGPVAMLFWTTTVVMLALQVSRVRYAKPTKNPVVFIPFSVMMILLFTKSDLAVAAALTLCAYGFLYAFVHPFFYRQALLLEEEKEHVTLDR
jgi:CDP-diacylglycerol--serine O-phosphatidyltransferase